MFPRGNDLPRAKGGSSWLRFENDPTVNWLGVSPASHSSTVRNRKLASRNGSMVTGPRFDRVVAKTRAEHFRHGGRSRSYRGAPNSQGRGRWRNHVALLTHSRRRLLLRRQGRLGAAFTNFPGPTNYTPTPHAKKRGAGRVSAVFSRAKGLSAWLRARWLSKVSRGLIRIP